MAFPVTSVLADFSWADEDPLTHGFNTPLIPLDYNAAVISGVADNIHGWASAYYNTVFDADCEVFADIATGSFGFNVYWRIQSPNSAGIDCYSAEFRTDDTIVVYRIINNSGTQISSQSSITINVGQQVGVSHIGSTIRYYVAGAEVGTPTTESTIGSAGYIGFRQFTARPLDNFGGGSIGGAGTPHIDVTIGL